MAVSLLAKFLLLLHLNIGWSPTWLEDNTVPQVTIGHTVIKGLAQVGSDTEFFGGIPYALPPVGELRFAPPVLSTMLEEESSFDASKYGPACTQPKWYAAGAETSEDCLTVDIIRPAGFDASSRLPVMAWIHGGGFTIGYTAEYNGTALVTRSIEREKPIIYISIAYRLGAFGFPNGVEATEKGALNLGLKDIITALQWIQANIKAFGGDKSKVTIFGESSGGMSIGDLYFNSGLESLTWAAIFASGSAIATLPPGADEPWKRMAKAVPSCTDAKTDDTFTCLRKASVKEIQDAQDNIGTPFPFFPVVDDKDGLIPDRVSRLISKGSFANVPFIAGTNLDEATGFTPAAIDSTEGVRGLLESQLWGLANDTSAQSELIEKFLKLYPADPAAGSPFGTGKNTFGRSASWKRACAINGDLRFTALRREWSEAASAAGVKNYGYLFTDPQPGDVGVTHGAEISYIFGPSVGLLNPEPAAGMKTLGPIMMDYWLSFATSRDPNDGKGSQRPKWPVYDAASPKLMELNADGPMSVSDDFRREAIELILENPVALGR